jgi:hypothetical protein
MHRLTSSLFAVLVLFVLSAGVPAAGDLPAQTSSLSGVTVKVTPRSLAGAQWDFEVLFDTHSGNLADDLMKSAVLLTGGGAQSAPSGWRGDGPGGHHRKGILSFKSPAARPAEVELRIARPGEPAPRAFRWRLK